MATRYIHNDDNYDSNNKNNKVENTVKPTM